MVTSSNLYNSDYEKQAIEFCEENLAIGGYRLAKKLIEIYDQILLNERNIGL
jgi:hypothetical protein